MTIVVDVVDIYLSQMSTRHNKRITFYSRSTFRIITEINNIGRVYMTCLF